jgi:carboxymethylenebutenolidase
MRAAVLGHYAEQDDFFGPEQAAGLQQALTDAGVDADVHVHPGVDHAFFNDTRPEVYDAAESAKAWDETLAFLRAHL